MHLQRGRHAELVDERREQLRIGFEGDEGRRGGGGIGICVGRHGGSSCACDISGVSSIGLILYPTGYVSMRWRKLRVGNQRWSCISYSESIAGWRDTKPRPDDVGTR